MTRYYVKKAFERCGSIPVFHPSNRWYVVSLSFIDFYQLTMKQRFLLILVWSLDVVARISPISHGGCAVERRNKKTENDTRSPGWGHIIVARTLIGALCFTSIWIMRTLLSSPSNAKSRGVYWMDVNFALNFERMWRMRLGTYRLNRVWKKAQ